MSKEAAKAEAAKERFYRDCVETISFGNIKGISLTPGDMWSWIETLLKEAKSKTGLFVKDGQELIEGCEFRFQYHHGCNVSSFQSKVFWDKENACFGYKKELHEATTPFNSWDELQEDFLNHIEIINNK